MHWPSDLLFSKDTLQWDTVVESMACFLSEHQRNLGGWLVESFSYISVSLWLAVGEVREQQGVLGYGNREEWTQSHTSERMQSCSDVSGWSCWRKPQCQNQLWPTAWEMRRWVRWAMLSLALRLMCVSVCVSVTDRLTDCRSPAVCMICPIL